MASEAVPTSLGPVLVVGGCGFIGFHIVRHLLLEPDCGPISVLSRNPAINRLDGVSYHAGDINSPDAIPRLLSDIKPQVIFHVASPRANNAADEHFNTSVYGTKNLLACAVAAPSVRALVYTSSAAVARGYEHFSADETVPLWEQDSKTIPYFKAKALADVLVREANSPLDPQGRGLHTVTLRLSMVYGERDNQFIPGQLETVQAGQTKVQLGNGKNLVEPLYVGNAAAAHILAAKGLLASESNPTSQKVDGEAFFISDGDPQPFWDYSRRTWRHAGDTTKPEEVTVVPAWIALSMASGLEWAYLIFTLGRKRPPLKVSRLYVQYTIYNTTYNIDKAKERLGYKPVVDHDGNLKRSVKWELENHGENYPRLKVV